MEIRHLNETDDRLAISRIYEESWKYAYKDIIPREYLDSIPKGQWGQGLDVGGRYTLVAVEGRELIGTSSFCRGRMAEMSDFGEAISIYFLPEYMGKGYGKLLLEAVTKELAQLGFDDIYLWVLEDNHNARRFYKKFGFLESGRSREDTIGGKRLREIQYCYRI